MTPLPPGALLQQGTASFKSMDGMSLSPPLCRVLNVDTHRALAARPFFYFGTDAYWLHQLSDHDIDLTLKTIASKNITVVRTWAFNDVFEIPTTGAWFQVSVPDSLLPISAR